jgi:hypothetical protein
MASLFDPEDLHVPPKRRVLSELHGVRTQKAVLFIDTTVRTSNLKKMYFKQNTIVNMQSLCL